MRIGLILFSMLLLACNSHKKVIVDDYCKKKLQVKKELFDKLFITSPSLVKTITLEKIAVHKQFEKIFWEKKMGGRISIKDSTKFRLMLVQNELHNTMDNLCTERKLSRPEIKKLFGTPTKENIGSLIYHYNIEGTRECYDENGWPLKYGKCAFLLFEFDESNVLKNWMHTYLFPYDLAAPIAGVSLELIK